MSSISAHLVAVAAASDRIDGGDQPRDAELPDGSFGSNLLLDTLASICVRKGKGEVYAVAMQLYGGRNGGAGGKLTLTIAGDSGVPPEVISHLQSVVSQFQAITARCHTFRKDCSMRYPLKYNKISIAQLAIIGSAPLITDLKVCIYRHSIEKFVHRIEKRYEAFLDFMERLDLYMDTALDQDDDAWRTLLDVHNTIVAIAKSVLPTDFEYEHLVSVLDTLNRKVRVVLNSDAVTEWPDAMKRKYPG